MAKQFHIDLAVDARAKALRTRIKSTLARMEQQCHARRTALRNVDSTNVTPEWFEAEFLHSFDKFCAMEKEILDDFWKLMRIVEDTQGFEIAKVPLDD